MIIHLFSIFIPLSHSDDEKLLLYKMRSKEKLDYECTERCRHDDVTCYRSDIINEKLLSLLGRHDDSSVCALWHIIPVTFLITRKINDNPFLSLKVNFRVFYARFTSISPPHTISYISIRCHNRINLKILCMQTFSFF